MILLLGAVLMIAALLLLLHNKQEASVAGQEAESLTVALEAWMERQEGQTVVAYETEVIYEQPEAAGPELPSATVGGCECVGLVEIPALELKLPVLADWDYGRLEIAPCRQFGSAKTDDLVIAAHNYQTHFGRLKELVIGDEVTFTDVEGAVYAYTVKKTDIIAPENVEAVSASGFDLVLYTCAVGGQSRVTVFCDRTEEA